LDDNNYEAGNGPPWTGMPDKMQIAKNAGGKQTVQFEMP
jgi:hypothetical protein